MRSNFILDRVIRPVTFAELQGLDNIKLCYLDIDKRNLRQWVHKYYPAWRQLGTIRHKKLLEFHATFLLSNPTLTDVVMDVAAGCKTYITNVNCAKRYVQDLKICSELKTSPDVHFIEGDAGSIDLPDESVDVITAHHSFEHFRADSDVLFIREIQRLLKPKGRCCIVPIFIADVYVEVTNQITFDLKFDAASHLL